MREKFANEKIDFNPRSWLSGFRKTSIVYLVEMLMFYHGIGLALLLIGTLLLNSFAPAHQEPTLQRSLSSVLTAGPIEESIFFGIPFYISGNTFVLLASGSAWAVLHVFNSGTLDFNQLAFGNALFVFPSLFFSLRTWASGKGWFAVIVHSAWNVIFFEAGCITNEFRCTTFDLPGQGTVISIAASAVLVGVTYFLYRMRRRREKQPRPLAP